MVCAMASPSAPEVAAETTKPRRSRKRRVTCTSFALSSMTTIRSGEVIRCTSRMRNPDQPAKWRGGGNVPRPGGGEVIVDGVPHTFDIDDRIAVHEHVPEIDDVSRLRDSVPERRVNLQRNAQRLADRDQLPFDREPAYLRPLVFVERHAGRHASNTF